MADVGVQIDWGAASTADVVAATRRTLMASAKPFYRPAAVHPKPSSLSGATGAVTFKRVKTLGGAVGLPRLYAVALTILILVGIAGVWNANVLFAPEMYDNNGLRPAVDAFTAGKKYAVFDLNINIRRMKELYAARFSETPDVIVLGASHWQEAHSGLIRSERMYNGHVHRDYWEDMLGEVEVYTRNKRLPKRIVMAIRDNLFTPVRNRKDFLWEPGIPNYRRMADRLGIEKESFWNTFPYQRMKERLSLSMLFNNVTRWNNTTQRPHASVEKQFEELDTLLPDGSILWSEKHRALFTAERTEKEAKSFADRRRFDPPTVDPKGVEAIDALLGFLGSKGVQVVLVHPPFNPQFYNAVQDGSYPAGLDRIRQITRELAAKHHLKIIGEFDPYKVGCTAAMYIDAEHGNPSCLQKIFDQYEAILPELKRTEGKVQG